MKLRISPLISKKFPKLNIGIVIARNIDNTGSDKKIHHLLEEVEELIKLNTVPADLAKHDMISPWRAAYSDFGAKPSKYNCSIEALMKRILKGDDIPRINKIVDIYNYLSLKYLIPIGADDLDKVEGDIALTISDGAEIFIPLNSEDVENPKQGEVIYKDSRHVLCRRWNWRECNKTKITEDTKNLIIYTEGLPPVTKEKLKEVGKEIIDTIKTFCGGEAEFYILNIGNSEIEF